MSTSLRDTLIRERYLLRLDWAMQDYPKSKAVVRELRTELTATASEVGMRQAVADLGHPRVLADAYLSELGRPVPRWTTGAVWGTLAVGAVMYLADGLHLRDVETIIEMGGGTVERVFLGATITFTNEDEELSVMYASTFTWQGSCSTWACVFVVPLLLGARAWRVWSGSPATGLRRARLTVRPAPGSAASTSRRAGPATTAAARAARRPPRARRSWRRCRCSTGWAGCAA